MKKVRLSLAQINPVVGDLGGNIRKIISYIKKAGKLKADIVAFPELAITGYPPEDLLLKPQFVKDNIDALNRVMAVTRGITAVIGFVDGDSGSLYNSAAIVSNGKLINIYHKNKLPNYGVFDEYRYFQSGRRCQVYKLGGITFGVNICEDIWFDDGPAKVQAMSGADIIININASPYHLGKASFRKKMVCSRVSNIKAAIAYVNMIGGQDELIFDGGSFVIDSTGKTLVRAKQFAEELVTVDIEINGSRKKTGSKLSAVKRKGVKTINIPFGHVKGGKPSVRRKKLYEISETEEIYSALRLGTRDYVRKNGFKGVVIGISGGVDSALVAAIAVDALGRENVHGLFMPSVYTSKESYEDVDSLAARLGIKSISIPINNIFTSYLKTLDSHFNKTKTDTTEENLQARIRGNILMAFSNKFGWLVLATGNKSEMSVGYATLYGDMAGGFAVIKDVPKIMVYELCKWRNLKEGRDLIPERILWKEPTAELKHDQRDVDTLPPYPILDPILKAYVEDDKSFDKILGMGCDLECARSVVRMVDSSEYKRRQAPPGIKITARAFGKDRRFPITNRYKSY
ncbi:MAG TPA: NAD+ synthase [Nitrospirae bacterium]|nr:NAD+ synthase [Nitrospirota bacterium]